MNLRTHPKCLPIGVDLMGGDRSPLHLFQAIEMALHHFPSTHFIIYLTQEALDQIRDTYACALHPNLIYTIVSEVIEMQDDPLAAIRHKKMSSLMMGLKHLKKKDLQGFVSMGNTGALVAGATLSLPLLPGIQRSALLAVLPTQAEEVAIIDVGGNVHCKPHHLIQFAQMGIAYIKCVKQISVPRVGLLNIGIESKKGTSEVRQAYELLQQQAQTGLFTFVGNVEGRELFEGVVDVLVTDGFTGNVLLKTSEGVAAFMLQQLKRLTHALPTTQEQSIFDSFYRQFNDENHQGAILCGVDCVAVKCHGKSSSIGLFNGIKQVIRLVQDDFISKIKHHLVGN
jgi:phosphate acyltransferase